MFLKFRAAKVQDFLKKPANTNPAILRPLSILIFIVSLLTEHCDFDRVRRENSCSCSYSLRSAADADSCLTALTNDLDMVSKVRRRHGSELALTDFRRTPSRSTCTTLYWRYTASSPMDRCVPDYCSALVRGCLRTRRDLLRHLSGFLFRAYPTLMTLESSAEMMDAIFASPEEDVRGRLLKIIQDFLISESIKHSTREKGPALRKTRLHIKLTHVCRVEEQRRGRGQHGEARWQHVRFR